MSRSHVSAIYFEGRAEAAKKRLHKLKAAGFIGARTREVNRPSVLFLAKKGLQLLHTHGILSEYPPFSTASLEKRAHVSDLTIRHELEVMDVKAAFYSALRNKQTFSIADFCTWPHLNEFKAYHRLKGPIVVRPDGFARILETIGSDITTHRFFLEVDRSTETLDTIVSRVECYIDHYRSGGFAMRNGGLRHEYRRHPFRILIVCKSRERGDNIAERLLKCVPPVFNQAWLSTFLDAAENPLGAIWRRPIDHQNRVEGCTGLFVQ